MLPLKLDIENFYCHSKSIINFNDFDAAVIVGRINGNDKFSNGAGKSTIFAAIKYVLFNEVDTSSLEKVIKHGQDFCRVSFEFQSSIDQQIYRIIRFRGRKPGAEVRLFRKLGEGWDDLTQRTSTETDKEIVKLIKINYRTFSNSVLFAQGDMSGIAAMTPRERKTALKEALQLGIYSKYEALIKKKVAELTKDLDKTKTIISTVGKPTEDIVLLKKRLKEVGPKKIEVQEIMTDLDGKISFLQEKTIIKQKDYKELKEKIDRDKGQYKELDVMVRGLTTDLNKYQGRIVELEKQEFDSFNRAKSLMQEIKATKATELRTEDTITAEIVVVRNNIIEQQSDLKQLEAKLSELRIPLTNDAICKHCRQTVDPEARKICQEAINQEILNITAKINSTKLNWKPLNDRQTSLTRELEKGRMIVATLNQKEFELGKEKKSVISAKTLLAEFSELRDKTMLELDNKKALLQKIEINKTDSLVELENKIEEEIVRLKTKSSSLMQEKKLISDQLSALSNDEAVISHGIEQKEKDEKKLSELNEALNRLEYQFSLHQKVLTAFGPSGIPALITHTILDDYQIESNNVLDKLRPGLRLQFLTENEKSDGEMSDTLEITYFLNNTELEFSQLSGAQKLLVSLALRLGLAAVISKRLGIDLRMILIDEADQSLDEGALETFEQAIKELQKEYKILIITHNPEIKMKFGHAIIVEQDNQLNSTARVSDGW